MGGTFDCSGNCDRPTAINDPEVLITNATWCSSFPIDNNAIGDMTTLFVFALLSLSAITLSIPCFVVVLRALHASSCFDYLLSDRIDFCRLEYSHY